MSTFRKHSEIEATGRFLLELWKDPEGDPYDDWDSVDNVDILREKAIRELKVTKQYRYAIIYEWNYTTKEWDEREHFREDDFLE